MDAQQAPLVHVSTVWGGAMPPGFALGLVFLLQNGRHIGRDICLHPGCSAARYGWLGSFLEGTELYLLGELSFYQQQRNTTLLASNIFSGQRAAGGWWTLRKRHVLTVSALICSFCSFRVLADSNCDLKYSYDLWQLCVNLEDFFFFFFQDDEKQRQRSHSWIKNKRTVDSTDKIHFQRSGDENESVSLSHCWRLKKKEMRLCF